MKDIVFKNPAELIPYEKNPRNIGEDAVNAVAESIKEFGFRNPILVDKDNVIIAGHTRQLASLKLNLPVVPVIVCDDLTDKQVKALRLADNKTNELAGWNFGELDTELADLADFDMERFGFSTLEDFNSDNFFQEEEPKDKEKKTIICPHCGEEIEI